jgi:hypothetical protein
MVSELRFTTSYRIKRFSQRSPLSHSIKTYLHGGHDLLDALGVQLEHAIQDVDLIVAKRLFTSSVELEERLEFGLLVGVVLVRSKDPIKELCQRIGDRGYEWRQWMSTHVEGCNRPKRYIMPSTSGEHAAPMARP